jgi:transcriptional regulator with XRE-family HTH domain
MSYAERILAARQKLRVGQRRFARLLGVEPSTVQNWERGRREPQGLYLQRLETLLREMEGDQARSDPHSSKRGPVRITAKPKERWAIDLLRRVDAL